MSQRGNKVFFDQYQTNPAGSNIQIITDVGAPPTTFSTDAHGCLVMSNDWNGIAIDNGDGANPSITFGPTSQFKAKMDTNNDASFAVHVNNTASSSLLINAVGNTTLSGNLTVNRETVLSGNLNVSKAIVTSGQIRSVGPNNTRIQLDGTQPNINIDISQGSFVYIDGNGDNNITCSNFNVGDQLYLQTSGTSGTITFSTGFAVSFVANQVVKHYNILSFICDGYHMLGLSNSNWAL